jgi:hypothetical protein
MLVRGPIATSHTVFGGIAINAWYIASTAWPLTAPWTQGSRLVPSMPLAPQQVSLVKFPGKELTMKSLAIYQWPIQRALRTGKDRH